MNHVIKVTVEPATGYPVLEIERGLEHENAIIPLRDDVTLRDLLELPNEPLADYIDYEKKQRIEEVRRSVRRKRELGFHVIRAPEAR